MTVADQPHPYGSGDKTGEAVARKSLSSSASSSSDMDLGTAKQDAAAEAPENQITREKMINTLLICLLQLLNFMDRYALPGTFIHFLKTNQCA